MKAKISLFLITLLILVGLTPNLLADYSEKVTVIKFDKDRHDLIVKRSDGELLLIQHNRVCGSMSTEFPVTLIWNGDEIESLRVNFNEMCKVYNFAPYHGEGRLTKLIKSQNLIVTDHEAEMVWLGKKYLIDYGGENCRYVHDFLNRRIYLNLPTGELEGGQIIFPGNRGQCDMRSANEVGIVSEEDPNAPEKLTGLDFQAQNNQVYFYWDEKQPKEGENPFLYLISYSKHRIDPDDYLWKEMPNLIYTRRHSFTVRRLANKRTYYFYLATLNSNNVAGPWTEITATPVSGWSFKNKPDFEEFEIESEDLKDSFRLYWPSKDDVRRYFVRFYLNGKLQFFKIFKPEQNEIIIPKKAEYLNKRLRLTVRVIPKNPYGEKLYDGIFWVYRSED